MIISPVACLFHFDLAVFELPLFELLTFGAVARYFHFDIAIYAQLCTVMSFDIQQKKGQNREVEWSKLTLSKCAVEGLNCHEVDNFEF